MLPCKRNSAKTVSGGRHIVYDDVISPWETRGPIEKQYSGGGGHVNSENDGFVQDFIMFVSAKYGKCFAFVVTVFTAYGVLSI